MNCFISLSKMSVFDNVLFSLYQAGYRLTSITKVDGGYVFTMMVCPGVLHDVFRGTFIDLRGRGYTVGRVSSHGCMTRFVLWEPEDLGDEEDLGEEDCDEEDLGDEEDSVLKRCYSGESTSCQDVGDELEDGSLEDGSRKLGRYDSDDDLNVTD